MTLGPRQIHELLTEAGLEPRRSLGQNFVADPNTVRRIARLAGVGPGDRVVEIGAGLGSLTLALIETGASVTAIETDGNLVPILRTVVDGRARVVHADAREIDWSDLLGADGGWHLVANLPYNIATSLVLDVLADVPQVDHLLVMVQREAGERMVARPGTKAYGAVSVRVEAHASGSIVGTVSPEVFHPKPKVTSVLVALERHGESPLGPDIDARVLDELVGLGFAQRRKMLRGALRSLVSEDQLTRAGIEPTRRAEELRLADWAALTRVVTGDRDRPVDLSQ